MRRGIPIRTDTYVVDDKLIWGATARILADLFDRLGAALDHPTAVALRRLPCPAGADRRR